MKKKSVQSENPPLIAGQACISLPCRQAGVIQTSYDIVKAHGGELSVSSQEGNGSVFTIKIPAL